MPKVTFNKKTLAKKQCLDLANRLALVLRAQQHMLNLRDKNLLKRLAQALQQDDCVQQLAQMPQEYASLETYHRGVINELVRIHASLSEVEMMPAVNQEVGDDNEVELEPRVPSTFGLIHSGRRVR